MSIQLRDKSACKYDQISLGEVMLRLDPGVASARNRQNLSHHVRATLRHWPDSGTGNAAEWPSR